tara:strand:- start:1097 stop:1267 length:171 start_codon:yes stop_codon:yes gene_type:complete
MKNGLYAASCSVVPKHRYGLRRRDWSGFDGFEAYVWTSVLAGNLVTFAWRESEDPS